MVEIAAMDQMEAIPNYDICFFIPWVFHHSKIVLLTLQNDDACTHDFHKNKCTVLSGINQGWSSILYKIAPSVVMCSNDKERTENVTSTNKLFQDFVHHFCN